MNTSLSKYFSQVLIEKYLSYTLIILLLVFTVSIILLGSVPPIDRDALTHHLFIPKLYLQHGGIYEIPEIPFSYYPMNLDLLYMIPLYFGNDIVPKYIHFGFAILTAGLVYNYLQSRTSFISALLGSLLLLSIPVIVKLSISAYVDLGLMFFSTASVLLIFHWLNSDYKLKYLFLAGICCGLAAGVKYNGIVTMAILVLMVPLIYIRSAKHTPGSDRKGLGYCFIFFAIALLVYSPWGVRNYFWTGNPIYPLHDSFFNPSQNLEFAIPEHSSESAENSVDSNNNPFVSRKILYKETWWQTLLLPIRFFFEGQDDNPQFFDGKLSPLLLFLPMLAFIRHPPSVYIRREKVALLTFAFLFFFFTFFLHSPRIRYVICVIPPLCILSIFSLQNLFVMISEIHSSPLKKFTKACAIVVPVIFLTTNFGYLIKQFHIYQPFTYLSGRIKYVQYVGHFLPEFPTVQRANELTNVTKILAIFLGNRGYYFDKPVQFDLKMNKSLFFEMIKDAKDANQVSEELNNQNFSHLLIRNDLFEQWIKQQLDKNEFERLKLFFKTNTQLLYEANGYGLYQLKASTNFL